MRRSLIVIAPLVVAVAACAPPRAQPSPEIADRSESWERAYNSGDVGALVGMYTDDARLLPPNAELGQGHGDIETMFGEEIAAGHTIDLETIETVAAGGIGFRVGVYSVLGADGGVVDRGKFIETWRLVDGEWKISNDIWNSNMPASVGETIVVTHEVEDFDGWLAAWHGDGGRPADFAEHGISGARTFQSQGDPNLVALVLGVSDMDAWSSFMASDAAKAAMAEDGVKDSTLRTFTEVE